MNKNERRVARETIDYIQRVAEKARREGRIEAAERHEAEAARLAEKYRAPREDGNHPEE